MGVVPGSDVVVPGRMTPATVTRVSKGRPKEIVRLSEKTVAALVERAEVEGVSKSDIMRRAIEKELGMAEDE